ncbi:MAG: hypothetical protein HZA31_13820 [Opitutae bacterium]|nr:hypothetical protein [Opitutae bacterium]
MKSYYRVMLGKKSAHAPACFSGGFIGTDFGISTLREQRRIVAKVEQLMALVDTLETQLAAGRATAEKLLSALVAELTGTKNNGQALKPAASARRGRPRKS